MGNTIIVFKEREEFEVWADQELINAVAQGYDVIL